MILKIILNNGYSFINVKEIINLTLINENVKKLKMSYISPDGSYNTLDCKSKKIQLDEILNFIEKQNKKQNTTKKRGKK